MNYYTIRIILIILIIVVIFSLNKFLLQERIKIKGKIIICLVVYITIFALPFESLFYKFKSPRQLFRYRNPTSKIIKEYIYKNYAFIYSEDSKENPLQSYILSNGSWTLDKKAKIEVTNYNGYSICINRSSYKNAAGIFIVAFSEIGETISISDSLGSNFDNFDEVDNFLGAKDVVVTRITIIDSFPENYTLYINGNEYSPL